MRMRMTGLVLALLLTPACSNPEDQERERQHLLNEQRIETLRRGNDSLTRAREVIFWAGFKRPSDVKCFDDYLGTQGYTVLYTSERPDEAWTHVVEFSKSMIPDVALMDETVFALMQGANACNGLYREWEAPVVP